MIEVWREHVYPELKRIDFVEKSSMVAYMVVRALGSPQPAAVHRPTARSSSTRRR